MARTWKHVDQGGPTPDELELLRLCDRFGTQAIFGRPFRAREVIAFQTVEAILKGYASRATSTDWVQWATANKELNALLIRAQQSAEDAERIRFVQMLGKRQDANH